MKVQLLPTRLEGASHATGSLDRALQEMERMELPIFPSGDCSKFHFYEFGS